MAYLREGCVLSVEFGHPVVGYKELASVGVGTTIGHGYDSPSIVLQVIDDFVFERLAIDTLALFAGASRISSLNDEAFIS